MSVSLPDFAANIFNGFSVTDVIDIIIVAFVAYKILGFIQETRAEQLVKGLLFLVVATYLSGEFNLYTLNWLLEGTITLGVIALVIVFQPELRRGLEYIGRGRIIKKQFGEMGKDQAKRVTGIIVEAVDFFSSNKVGALIVMEREISLNDIIETGTVVDAALSTELLGNIFYKGAPLHDGAAIVRQDRVAAASCVLPLTQNRTLSKDLGTRHRAGIGITENSDAMAIIVSEETGIISIAVDGRLTRFLDIKTVEKTVLNSYLSHMSDEEKKNPFTRWFGGQKKDE
ncbi:MAG: diadenylate cyclase CdaA [Bacillota bacterium]|nr:diadenylate cyclase CdaA [Bacillota bacterium]